MKPKANPDAAGRTPQKHSGRTGKPISPINFVGLDDNGEVSEKFIAAQKLERRLFAAQKGGSK